MYRKATLASMVLYVLYYMRRVAVFGLKLLVLRDLVHDCMCEYSVWGGITWTCASPQCCVGVHTIVCLCDSGGDKDRKLIYLQFSVWKWDWVSVGVNLCVFFWGFFEGPAFKLSCLGNQSTCVCTCVWGIIMGGRYFLSCMRMIVRKKGMLLQVVVFIR